MPSQANSCSTQILEQPCLTFESNRLLIDLCGEYDCNLARLEHELSLQIARRGNALHINGASEDIEIAHDILQDLYERLEAGKPVTKDHLDSALRGHPHKAAAVQKSTKGIEAPIEIKTRKKIIEPRTQAQKQYVSALLKNELSFGIGPAGTGKTYLAVAVGVSLFLKGEVDRIILSRPAVEAGEKLGYLPGDMKEKVDPYMQPLYDALNDTLPGKQLAKMMEEKRIEIAPLAFMRGRTLYNAFVVLDEAQNTTPMQMKMFLTRLGQGSRMVITGDLTQIDLPNNAKSGLREAERILQPVKSISFTQFTAQDVVRHPLVAAIINAYDKDQANRG